MTGDLAAVIDAARVDAFVGRSTEVAIFRSALAGHGALRVLFIHGPGGIGKTTLLHQFRIRARDAGRPVVGLDGRDIDCSPMGFLEAFDAAGNPAAAADPFVLLVDGYDRLFALDDWVRQTFIPSLPSDCVVVLVSREPPARAVAHRSRLARARRCPATRPARRHRERRPADPIRGSRDTSSPVDRARSGSSAHPGAAGRLRGDRRGARQPRRRAGSGRGPGRAGGRRATRRGACAGLRTVRPGVADHRGPAANRGRRSSRSGVDLAGEPAVHHPRRRRPLPARPGARRAGGRPAATLTGDLPAGAADHPPRGDHRVARFRPRAAPIVGPPEVVPAPPQPAVRIVLGAAGPWIGGRGARPTRRSSRCARPRRAIRRSGQCPTRGAMARRAAGEPVRGAFADGDRRVRAAGGVPDRSRADRRRSDRPQRRSRWPPGSPRPAPASRSASVDSLPDGRTTSGTPTRC